MAKWILAVILIIAALYCKPEAEAVEIVVHPEGSNCGEVGSITQCYPISSLYVDNPNRLEIVSNTTLLFQPGTYVLESSILFQNIQGVTVRLLHDYIGNTTNVLSQFYCKKRSGLLFINVTDVVIFQVIMNNCGTNVSQALVQEDITLPIQSRFLKRHYDNWVKAAIFAANVHNLTIYDSRINGSHGYGILGINIFDSFIFLSWFNGSNMVSLMDHCMSSSLTYLESTECQGGNALFLYYDFTDCPHSREFHTLIVSRTDFTHGVHPPPPSDYTNITWVGGFALRLFQKYYDVDVAIFNSTFAGNGVLIPGRRPNSHQGLSIKLAAATINSSIFVVGSHFIAGSGIFIVSAFMPLEHEIFNLSCTTEISQNVATTTPVRKLILQIFNCDFSYNRQTSLAIVFLPRYRSTIEKVDIVLIQYCTFDRNSATGQDAIWLLDHGTRPHAEILIEATIFSSNGNAALLGNFNFIDLDLVSTILSTIKVESVRNVTFRNCIFKENKVSTISAQNSHVFFEGIHHFANNSAFNGGAIFLSSSSVLLLRPGTELYFTNNRALRRGGAIFIEGNRNELFFYECHIQVYDPTLQSLSQLGIHMLFINNTASEAGDALYGGQIDTCQALAPSGFFVYDAALIGQFIFDVISHFVPQNTNSLISSDALYICFCIHDTFNCNERKKTVFHYPGEMLHILMIGLGQRNGTVPAVVFAHLASCSNIEGPIISIETEQTCSMINCSLSSLNDVEYLMFEVDAQIAAPDPLLVEIIVHDCETLIGFTLDNISGVCVCVAQLRDRNMTCAIDSKSITRQPPYWLGNYSNHLLLHDNCPYDYCRPDQVQIVMTEPNISEQCAFNRYGTLCGSCKEGFSHVFGSSRCRKCSNSYFGLLTPFGLVGITLISLLFIFNLTTYGGKINGFIFYANIVHINGQVFFSPGEQNPFKTFISWINLDLGIEACFYNGMRSHTKLWLQFVFPLYLIILLTLVAIIYHLLLRKTHSESEKFYILVLGKLGRRIIPVLATILMLSYTKLLQVIFTVLSFTRLDYPDGSRVIWLYNGNITFGRGNHLPLFIISLILLVLAILPYIILLVLFPLAIHTECSNSSKIVRCLNRQNPLKNFVDAYINPYKSKSRLVAPNKIIPHCGVCWPVLLLVTRAFYIIVFASTLGDPGANLFVIIAIMILLVILNLSVGGVYKSHLLTVLETAYLLNIGILAAATSVSNLLGTNQASVVYLSIVIAVITFASAYIYQGLFTYITKHRPKAWCSKLLNHASDGNIEHDLRDLSNSGSGEQPKPCVTTTTIEGIPEDEDESEMVERRTEVTL